MFSRFQFKGSISLKRQILNFELCIIITCKQIIEMFLYKYLDIFVSMASIGPHFQIPFFCYFIFFLF